MGGVLLVLSPIGFLLLLFLYLLAAVLFTTTTPVLGLTRMHPDAPSVASIAFEFAVDVTFSDYSKVELSFISYCCPFNRLVDLEAVCTKLALHVKGAWAEHAFTVEAGFFCTLNRLGNCFLSFHYFS